MATVLLTRPQAASEPLAHALQECGYEGVIEPLLTIIPAPTPMPEIANIQALMITSANAIESLAQGGFDAAQLFDLPCYCVGERTAAKASQYGFRHVEFSTGDGVDLAQKMERALSDKSRPILHIAGQNVDVRGRNELERLGFTVATWEVYMAMPARELSGHTLRLLQERKIDAVLFFSARTAETFAKLMRHHMLQTCCERLIAIGLSEAVTQPLTQLPWRSLVAAPGPSEEAMIASLKESLPVTEAS